MPTINFTNATGSFTYEESATPPIEPPIEPPPVTNTKGEVTQFNPANGSNIKVGGLSCEVEHDTKASWGIANPDPYTLRFEVRSGDRFTSSGWTDPTTSERSEVEFYQSKKPAGTAMAFEYGFVLEEGKPNTSQWMVLGQWHQTVAGGSPPFSFNMYGEKFHVLIRSDPSKEQRVFVDPNAIVRGRKYALRAEVKFASPGYCRVWRDDVQIVNFTGNIGYGSGESYYWKNGIYRNEAAETVAASYSNLAFA